MTNRHLSVFRYPGGKSWLAPAVRSWLARTGYPDVFVDLFAGGGSIALTVAAEHLAGRVVMIELDRAVAAVWRVLVDGSDQDVAVLTGRIAGFEMTTENVRALLDAPPAGLVEAAFTTIVRNRAQRGGIMAARAGLLNRGERDRGISSRWYPATLISRIEATRSFRHRIDFIHGDALELIGAYHGAAMFADPPYSAGGKNAGARLYTHHRVDHDRLFALIHRHAGDALLTYDDNPDVRALAAAHGFDVGTAAMQTCHHRRVHELVIAKRAGQYPFASSSAAVNSTTARPSSVPHPRVGGTAQGCPSSSVPSNPS